MSDENNVLPFPKGQRYLTERGLTPAVVQRLGLEIAPENRLRDLKLNWPRVDRGIVWHVRDINGIATGNVGARVWYKENPFAPDAPTDAPKFITPKGQKPRLYYSPLAPWKSLKKNNIVYLCESFLKADIMCALGQFAVGVTGIHGWSHRRNMIDDLRDLALMDVNLVALFDSNVHEKDAKNMRALEDIRAEFDNIQKRIVWLPLPPKIEDEENRVDWGIDDLYVARGQAEVEKLLDPKRYKDIVSGLRSMLRIFDRQVVYAENVGRVIDEKSGAMFSASQAITSRWAHITHYDGDKVINVCRSWLANKHRRSVHHIEYQPGMDRVVGGEYFNLWKGWGTEPKDGTAEFFTQWTVDAFPNEEERKWFLDWLAWPIQNPQGRMTQACILLGRPGVGKGWLAQLLTRIYGLDNVAYIDIEKLASKFNADFAAKHLVIVEESDAVWQGNTKRVNNRIKDYITQSKRRVERKGVDAFMIPAVGHLLMQGNDIDVVKLDEEDRRVAVLWIEGYSIANKPEYWKPRFDWLEGDGPGEVMNWLMERDISGFDPQGIPPLTAAKREMIQTTRTSFEGWIQDLIHAPDSVLVTHTGVEVTDRAFTARELLWLCECNPEVGFNELKKRDVDRMARELSKARVRLASDGYKVKVLPKKGSNFKLNPTRIFLVGDIEEPEGGWPEHLRTRQINKMLYG